MKNCTNSNISILGRQTKQEQTFPKAELHTERKRAREGDTEKQKENELSIQMHR